MKTSIREVVRVVTWRNSTVLGYRVKAKELLWTGLLWEHSSARQGSIWSADDPHIGVSWRHPDDADIKPSGCGIYPVRPRWNVGGRLPIGAKGMVRRFMVAGVTPVVVKGRWHWKWKVAVRPSLSP
jgi:hypothetical protein